MAGVKLAFLMSLAAAVLVQIYGQNDDQNCPPEWSIVHQCWKVFENNYKQYNNETALTLRQKEVEGMCSCMSNAVNQPVNNV